jgi:hypothetical protein
VIDGGVGLRDRALIGLMAYTFARIGALAFPSCRRVPSRFTQERPSAQRKPGNLWTLPRGQRFKLSARVERIFRYSRVLVEPRDEQRTDFRHWFSRRAGASR